MSAIKNLLIDIMNENPNNPVIDADFQYEQYLRQLEIDEELEYQYREEMAMMARY